MENEKKLNPATHPRITQQELNHLYVGVTHNFPLMVENPTKIILSCAFWTPMMPLISIWAIIFLIIDYWAAKYHLLRRSFKA